MEKANLLNCLSDPNNRPLGPGNRDKLKLRPHHASYNEKHHRLLIYLKRGHGGDYSTNIDMVESVCNLLDAGRLTQAYLVQCDNEGVVAWETVLNVARNLNGVVPREGEYGPYVWLEEHTFKAVGGNSWADDVLPF